MTSGRAVAAAEMFSFDRYGATRQRPSVVMLTDIPFWEQTLGSHARVVSVLRAIEAACSVEVLAFRDVDSTIRSAHKRLQLAAALFSFSDYRSRSGERFKPSVSAWDSLKGRAKDEWTQAAFNFLSQKKPDFVVIEYPDRSYLLDAVPSGTRTILDAHDVMSQRTLTFAFAGRRPSIVLSARDEALLLSRYDAVMAISPRDADVMRSDLGLGNVLHVPHAAVIAGPPLVRPTARRLLFTGGNSEANASGLKWFIDQVWPVVRDRFELHVVGTVCYSLAGESAGIVKHGVVGDLAKVHSQSDIVINPVFIGGGIKIKTLEAMSHGLPCVTTAEGARGLEDAVGTGLVVARQRLEFVDHLIRLAGDADRRRFIGEAAQAYVRERHIPSVAFRDLLLFLTCA